MRNTTTVDIDRNSSNSLRRPCGPALWLALSLVGCSAPKAVDHAEGTLSMLLSTDVNGATYRLRDAQFEISGPESLTLSSEDSPDPMSIEQILAAGDYSVSLADGW